MTALLEPAERMALTVGVAQVTRGDEPMPNVAAVCIIALARLAEQQAVPEAVFVAPDADGDPTLWEDGEGHGYPRPLATLHNTPDLAWALMTRGVPTRAG